ncbi:MAG: molybdopterin-dependent oxidoreductase [Pseudomonadales bacterium]|nr:molybdopterin-dependent oxidoreductase [Pseudomonadales bacterium]NRA14411.1 molybdopterin-dependent oxidoreductase [Oceanospirillaceae bacterium]
MKNQPIVELASVCPLDCPDTCSLRVTVEDDKIIKVRGSKVNPFTRGSVCTKVAKYYPDFIHGELRLRQPLLRTGPRGSGKYRIISWDDAIERVYQGLQQAIDKQGAQSILPLNYAGPHGKLAGGSMDRRFFSRLGASELNRSPLCGGVRSLAYQSMFGNAQGMPVQQVEFSDLIIIWGSNVSVTNLHLMRVVNSARKRGAKLIVIDPRRTQIARQADLFVQVTPGSDVALALKLVATLVAEAVIDTHKVQYAVLGLDQYLQHAKSYLHIDLQQRCGVNNDDFRRLVDYCRATQRLALSIGVGLERSRNGGAAIRAAQVLPVLLGSIGQCGHGILGNYGAAFKASAELQQKADLPGAKPRRVFNIVDVANHLLDRNMQSPIGALFIYNHNPLATHPQQNKLRQALSQEQIFIVGCDLQMNDSMLYADVILPAASHFEHQEIFSAYGHAYLQRAEAVIPPVGEALPNTEIFRRLAKRFGFCDAAFTDTDAQLIDQAFTLHKDLHAVQNASQIQTDQVISMQDVSRTWLSDEQLNTPSGQIEFYSQQLQEKYKSGLPNYLAVEKTAPFILLSPASDRRINASFGGSSRNAAELLDINPQDAQRLEIGHGDLVLVSNNLGNVQLRANITDAVAVGVLCCEKGAWCASSATGQTVNALISNTSKTDIGDGAAYYDTFVHVSKI